MYIHTQDKDKFHTVCSDKNLTFLIEKNNIHIENESCLIYTHATAGSPEAQTP